MLLMLSRVGAGSRQTPARELLHTGKAGGVGVLGVSGREDMHYVYHERYRKVSKTGCVFFCQPLLVL